MIIERPRFQNSTTSSSHTTQSMAENIHNVNEIKKSGQMNVEKEKRERRELNWYAHRMNRFTVHSFIGVKRYA